MQLFHLAFDAKILLPLQSRPRRWLKAEQGRGGRAEAEKERSAPHTLPSPRPLLGPQSREAGLSSSLRGQLSSGSKSYSPIGQRDGGGRPSCAGGVSSLSSRSEPPRPPGRRPGRVFQPSPQGAASCCPMLTIQSLLPPPNTAQASLRSVGPRRQPAHGRGLRECFSGTLTSGRLSVASARDPPDPPSQAGLCAAPGWGRQQTRCQRVGSLPSCGRQQCDEQPPCPSSTSAQKQGALPTPSLSALLWRRSNLDSPRLQPEAPLLICHW